MNYRKSEAKEAARVQFHGIWAAITSPFTADGRVDEAGLRRNMRYFTDGLKIDGVFCTGTMGEFWALTKEERNRIVEIVVEEAKGKCRVIAHTGHHSADETVELTRHAQDVGADFAIVINPYYPAANEAMIYGWFADVCSKVDIGIWMFDTGYAGYGLSAALTERIANLENVCGIKCSRPLEHYAQVRKLCGDRIVMSHPSESVWLTLMRDHGAKVHMSSATPFLIQTPAWRPMHQYTELALQGRFGEAEAIWRALQPVRDVHERWMRDPWVKQKIIAIAQLKAWSEMLGLAGGPVRPPLLQLTDEERGSLRADLDRVGLLARVSAGRQTLAA
jgi:4-hydroxy-tetrahydrodipicolinate synthase